MERLREILGDVTHMRGRAVIVIRLELGLRRGELCNIKLEDVNLANSEVGNHYLLIRPGSGVPWLFLTHTNQKQLDDQGVRRAWNDHFRPKYDETDRHAAVTSHYDRHRFTTYWMVEQDAPRELVEYMRGDAAGATPEEGRAGLDHYIHTYYEAIESLYREDVFGLGV